MKILIALLLAVVSAGCKKAEIDPREAILGKWEIFYHGNGEYQPPIKNPGAYSEFLPDSVLLEYDYATKTTYRRKYWIDSLLHFGSLRGDGVWLTFDFECQFNGDTMRLERKNIFAIFYISKHKRIK